MADKKQTSFADSVVWKVMNFSGNAITLNLLFVAAVLPAVVFTALRVMNHGSILFEILFYISCLCLGPAFCGLISAVRYYLRKDTWFKGFKTGYKTNLVQMMVITFFGSFVIDTMANDVYKAAYPFSKDHLVILISNSLILALSLAFVTATIFYNVFFPRKFIDLLRESANFVFKAPLQLVITGVLLFAPIYAILIFSKYILPFLIVFLAMYFSLIATIGIGLLKDPLIKVLQAKRESGELPPLVKEEEEE